MKSRLIIITVSLLGIILTGCIRTSEGIRISKELGNLKTQVDLNNRQINTKLDTKIASVRKNQVNTLSQIQSVNDNIRDLRNRIDILQHKLNNLKQDIEFFTTTGNTLNKSLKQRLSALETSMTTVKAWITASKASRKKAELHHVKKIKKRPGLTLDEAVKLFKKNKLKQAKPIFEKYSKKGASRQRARSMFYLGETAYKQKDYKTAITDYGVIVEKYTNSSLITFAYYMIGKSFVKLGDRKNAKLFFEELISRYPHNKLSRDARKELKRLK